MTHEQYERFRKLLDLTDDYLAGGIRRRRPLSGSGSQAGAHAGSHAGSHARAPQRGTAPNAGVPAHTGAEEPSASGASRGTAGAHTTAAGESAGVPVAAGDGAGRVAAGGEGAGRERQAALAALHEEVTACTLCPLHRERTRAVPGTGVLEPRVLVIGEGPGAEEDRQGLPFVGRAGQYLDDWLAAIELSRSENVYITNVVKCRPPGNRDPLPQEWSACNPYLSRQIALLQPQALLAVGRVASGVLTGSSDGIGKLRGRVHTYEGIPLVATYHPSGVLRNPAWRRPVWEDLKQLRAIISR